MALGCHGALQMLLEKQRKGKWIWTWANWLLGWCSVHARTQSGYGSGPRVCGSRPSQLRTGLWAVNAMPIMGYMPQSCNHMSPVWGVGPGQLICKVLSRSFHLEDVGCHVTTMLSHWRKRGPLSPADLWSKGGGETLTRRGCGRTMHCKGLVMSSRPLTFGSERWHRRLPNKLEKSWHVGKVYNLCRV